MKFIFMVANSMSKKIRQFAQFLVQVLLAQIVNSQYLDKNIETRLTVFKVCV